MLKLLTIFILMTIVELNVPKSFDSLRSPGATACFSGTWGNDFTLCGTNNVSKQGKGLMSARKNEELTIIFKPSGKGSLSFYDCQNIKRFKSTVEFTYTATDNQITFSWQGTPDEQQSIETTFQFKRSFQFTCKQDTLFFEKEFLQNTMYNGTNYFIRRN